MKCKEQCITRTLFAVDFVTAAVSWTLLDARGHGVVVPGYCKAIAARWRDQERSRVQAGVADEPIFECRSLRIQMGPKSTRNGRDMDLLCLFVVAVPLGGESLVIFSLLVLVGVTLASGCTSLRAGLFPRRVLASVSRLRALAMTNFRPTWMVKLRSHMTVFDAITTAVIDTVIVADTVAVADAVTDACTESVTSPACFFSTTVSTGCVRLASRR